MPEAPVNAGQPNLSAANSPADDTGGTKAPEPPPGPNNIGHLRGSSRSAPSDAGAMKAPARRLGWDSAGEIASADQTPRRQGTAEAVQATPPRGGAPVTVQAASPRGSRDTAAMERGGSAAAGPAAGANRRQASRKTRTAAAPSITGGPVPGARVLGRSGDHEKLFRALGVSDGFGPDVQRSRMMTVIVLDRGDAEVKRRFEAILMTGESAETAAYNPDLLVANGPDDLARAFNNLAGLYHQARDTAAAEILYRRAIDLWRKSEEKNSHLMATGFNNLAELYRAQGRQDQAAPLFKRAIDILSAPNTKPSPGLAAALQNLALIHHWRRDTERAELLYRKALDVAQGIGPAGRQVARATRRNYALLLRNMGRGEEAAKIEAAN